MGHSSNYGHVWISGDLDYYFLTGDRRARDVALQVADMMSSAMSASVGTHIRTLGWPTILVLSAYEATGDQRYLEAARRNWEALRAGLDPRRGWVVKLASDHCLHPEGSTRQERETKYKDQRCEGNVPFMEGLTLCALARYHRHTGDPAVLEARIAARRNDASDATVAVVRRQLERDPGPIAWIRLAAGGGPAALVAAARAALATANRQSVG